MTIISGGGAVVGAGGPVGPYEIERSLRFNSADSAYLDRTPASAGNRKTWTWSGWVKRGAIDANFRSIFSGSSSATVLDYLLFWDDNTLAFSNYNGTDFNVRTTQVFRDPSAWYHIVLSVDTTQATSSNRIKIYINGTQVTAFASSSYPTLNYDTQINNNVIQYIGQNTYNYFNGYLTEIHFIDGSALTPSSFGEFNSDTGVWQPIKYTGTYGTNGFYLNFSDNASTTTLGDDFSGNGNDWTTNNFSVTAGAGNDSLVDSPTRYGTDTGAGGEVRGNYGTLSPLWKGSLQTLTNGNLTSSKSSGTNISDVWGNFGMTSGKWYFECSVTAVAATVYIGIGQGGGTGEPLDDLATSASSYMYVNTTGNKQYGGTDSAYGNTYTAGDTIGCAVDMDNGKIWWSKNGTFQASGDPAAGTNAAYTDLLTKGSAAFLAFSSTNGASNSNTLEWNFGQRPFAYTAPSGFKALCTTNLPTPTIEKGGDYFNAILYTGTGSSNARTGVGFQPDLVWIKERNASADNALYDAVRGVQKQLESNNTDTETTESTGLTAFGSDGFTVGSLAQVNTSADTYVAWNWKANGAGVSNTDGTITSTVSVSTTSGFSIVTYTGTGANATVGHGLGVAPSMVICKNRSVSAEWYVYHASMGADKAIFLEQTAAASTSNFWWNNTAPTSTVFSLGDQTGNNGSGNNIVAYCFANVPGFSLMSSYVGNGSTDGPFAYLGFRPRWIMFKESSQSGANWRIWDTARSTYNIMGLTLYPSLANAEGTENFLDYLSNGFKIRIGGPGNGLNDSGVTYIYAAFAENPFAYALAR